MSTVILTTKAYDIVKDCCRKVWSGGESIKSILDAVQDIDAAISQIKPVAEAFAGTITIPRGPTVLPSGRTVTTQAPRVILGPELSQALTRLVNWPSPTPEALLQRIKDAAKRLEQADPCSQLLGCVAEGFRKNALDQKEERVRKKLLDKGFVVHYVNKPNWPKKVQHTTRRG